VRSLADIVERMMPPIMRQLEQIQRLYELIGSPAMKELIAIIITVRD
jgi:hypothetical protein